MTNLRTLATVAALLSASLTSAAEGPPVLKVGGTYYHNSYLVEPTKKQFAAVPPNDPKLENRVRVRCYKWAKGTLTVASETEATLEFPNGFKLDVAYKIVGSVNDAIFTATGSGQSGTVLEGVEYKLLGSVFIDEDGNVTSVEGAIKSTKGLKDNPDLEPGWKPVGTMGHFVLSSQVPSAG